MEILTKTIEHPNTEYFVFLFARFSCRYPQHNQSIERHNPHAFNIPNPSMLHWIPWFLLNFLCFSTCFLPWTWRPATQRCKVQIAMTSQTSTGSMEIYPAKVTPDMQQKKEDSIINTHIHMDLMGLQPLGDFKLWKVLFNRISWDIYWDIYLMVNFPNQKFTPGDLGNHFLGMDTTLGFEGDIPVDSIELTMVCPS